MIMLVNAAHATARGVRFTLFVCSLLSPIQGFGAEGKRAPAPTKSSEMIGQANLTPTGETGPSGTVLFFRVGDDLRIEASVKSATPGEHGIHIHANGSCADKGKAAGDHWNPAGGSHGGPNQKTAHAGDLGNITVGADGNGVLEVILVKAQHSSAISWEDVIGKSVVFHASQDDLKSQPAGNAGDRIACGIIERAMKRAG
jgi:Cu-Zn family superoxide dismutase